MITSSFIVIPTRLYNTILLSFPLRAGGGVRFLFLQAILMTKIFSVFCYLYQLYPKLLSINRVRTLDLCKQALSHSPTLGLN